MNTETKTTNTNNIHEFDATCRDMWNNMVISLSVIRPEFNLLLIDDNNNFVSLPNWSVIITKTRRNPVDIAHYNKGSHCVKLRISQTQCDMTSLPYAMRVAAYWLIYTSQLGNLKNCQWKNWPSNTSNFWKKVEKFGSDNFTDHNKMLNDGTENPHYVGKLTQSLTVSKNMVFGYRQCEDQKDCGYRDPNRVFKSYQGKECPQCGSFLQYGHYNDEGEFVSGMKNEHSHRIDSNSDLHKPEQFRYKDDIAYLQEKLDSIHSKAYMNNPAFAEAIRTHGLTKTPTVPDHLIDVDTISRIEIVKRLEKLGVEFDKKARVKPLREKLKNYKS